MAVAFRRFRYRGSNGYGWDVYMLRKENGIWGRPERISSNFGPPDANYAVVSQSLNTDTLLGVFPCCDNTLRFGKAFRHRVEVETIRPQPAVPLPAEVRAEYTIPFSIEQAGLAPKSPQGMPSQYTLIWGDLHRHSFHSKCSSPTEGSPRDVLRHLRDILGCQVLALTDHTSHMSDAEFVWHIDALEEVCGDTCLPLYGLENGPEDPYHDTKLFARTRLLFEKLRLFTCTYSDRAALYARLKAEFPPQSVLAVRHIDKMYPANFGPKQHQDLTQSWDPELEVAMQVVRNKDGISFLSEDAQDGWRFPANMLHCGAQFGFIGGSDHTTHPFCLTGFWVKEFSVDGVWEALLQRRTIACANGKVFLWALCNGQPLGQAIAASRVEVDAFVASAFGVGRACLMRNGVPIGWQELTDQQGQLRFSDQPPPGAYWYCVTVEAGTAKGKGVSLAHSSPWFVTVEP